MHLSLNKLTSKYEKRIALIFYTHCRKLKESQSHIFPFILSCFSSVSNATNSFIHSLNRIVLKKLLTYIAGFLQSGALYANIPFKCL